MNNLICLGVNHQTAAIALREQLSLNVEKIVKELYNLLQKSCSECVIISTCNRLEVYAITESIDALTDWLAEYSQLTIEQIEPFLYIYTDKAVIQHLLSVACGVDSMVLGEPQILGQLKQAFALASEAEAIGAQLGHLFPFVFNVAKKIRTDTAIGANPISIAYMAVTLAKQIFADLQEITVLLIGAGEIIQLAAQHLYDQPIAKMIVANRTIERAEQLAEKVGGQAIRIGDIPDHLAAVDMIISSTASQLPILGKGLVERAIKQRKRKPLLIVDMAVPRDVESEVTELPDVYLYNIDDLQTIVDANLHDRQLAAKQAAAIIATETEHFQHWQNSLDSIPAICAYRQKVELIRDQQLEKAQAALRNGENAEQIIKQLARELTNKLMHGPSVQMRRVSYEGRSDLLEWAKRLLGINET